MKRLLIQWVALLALLGEAQAHTVAEGRGDLQIGADGEATFALELARDDLRTLLALPPGAALEPALDASLGEKLPTWLNLRADGVACPLATHAWRAIGLNGLRIEGTAACPAQPTRLELGWARGAGPDLGLGLLLRVVAPDGTVQLAVLAADGPAALTLREPPALETATRFGLLGVEHILTGWDHLAFLLALLVGCATWRRVLVVVTGFTVAHSVTLGLGATGVVTLAPELVEPIIAASIAVAAAMALRGQLREGARDHELALALGFGLIHGLGFAGLLADELPATGARVVPLLAFNGGVELGQLACVLLAYPLLRLVAREPARARLVFGGLLVGLILLGTGVCAERLLA